jgi:hypothetical protein
MIGAEVGVDFSSLASPTSIENKRCLYPVSFEVMRSIDRRGMRRQELRTYIMMVMMMQFARPVYGSVLTLTNNACLASQIREEPWDFQFAPKR